MKVIHNFTDKETGEIYLVGSTYPTKGHKPTKARIHELASRNNAIGRPVIEVPKAKQQSDKKEE